MSEPLEADFWEPIVRDLRQQVATLQAERDAAIRTLAFIEGNHWECDGAEACENHNVAEQHRYPLDAKHEVKVPSANRKQLEAEVTRLRLGLQEIADSGEGGNSGAAHADCIRVAIAALQPSAGK